MRMTLWKMEALEKAWKSSSLQRRHLLFLELRCF